MQHNKHILFLSYDGMTDPLGQSQVIPYLKGLTEYGYRFTLLSCDKTENYKAHKNYVESLLADFPINWISLPYHKNPPILSSIYDLRQIKKTIKKIQQTDAIDMVHTRPGVPTLAAVWMKKIYGTKFLNDVRGFWADERVDGGMWNRDNPIFKKVYNFFKEHEYECLQLAEHNVCLTQAAKKEMLAWNNLPNQPLKIEVIPCSADLELFDPGKITEVDKLQNREAFGIRPDDLVITYLGSIGGWYLTDEMMRFCKLVSEKIPQSKFLFIAPHRHEAILEAAAKNEVPLEKVIIKKAARHEVPAYLSVSDYSLFFIKPCYSKMSSSPTKHGEIMAMGIPVITNSGVGDVKEIVKENNAGFIVDDFTDVTFGKIINQLPNKNLFSKEKISCAASKVYSLQIAIAQYKKVYDFILG